MILVIARAILSWVNADPYNPIMRFLTTSTDVMLTPLRRKLKLVYGSMDFSPIVLLFIIYFMKFFVAQTLLDYSAEIKRKSILGSAIVTYSQQA